eukprot:TRINITY_DN65540_c0_g1_i1.p1 TRINITY_DN65540_c0_g1~~TRINITY_DN65540_c0_g1_i1.p1  ORF type:complete len:276 (+),score=119.00 TRINITY_DN65540_c0_g1_i1:132-959(+)
MAEPAKAVMEAHKQFQEFKKLADAKNYEEANKVLSGLKLLFTRFPTFLNPEATTDTRSQEVVLVRETMEHAVLAAASAKDMGAFERHFEILRTYYTDFEDEPASERRLLILGLHLLRLLATNETRMFHMEMERITVVDQDSMYIRDVIQLERYLMEGSYLKMLTARKKAPSAHYEPLMEMLLETVRREVFKCAMRSYDSLSVDGARRLLMFDKMDDVLAFIDEERKKLDDDNASAWNLRGDTFHFSDNEQHGDTLPFTTLIQNQLHYSHELQRIA